MVGRHVGEEAVLWMWGLGGQGLCWLAHTSPLLSGASQAVYTVHQLSCSPVLSVLTWVVINKSKQGNDGRLQNRGGPGTRVPDCTGTWRNWRNWKAGFFKVDKNKFT